jgi:tetratricopeptide (TPR) repeat protein
LVEMESAEQLEDAIAVLIAEAEATADQAGRVERLQRAAQIYENQVGDAEKAYAVWQAAFNEDFTNEQSALALERLAGDLGTGLALAAEAGAQLREVSEGRQRAALLVWTARWLLRFTGDRKGAETHLLEALRLDPASRAAADGLRGLHGEDEPQAPPTPAPVAPPPAAPPPATLPVMDEATLAGARPRETGSLMNLHERLDALVEEQRWEEAVDVLKALAAGEGGEMRAKYLATAGKILHHKLNQDQAAVELLNRALDAHPNDLKSFERLYQILASRREWPAVEANLLRMIERFQSTEAAHGTMEALWRRLADVYRVGLKDLDAAARAYQMCARLAPHDPRYPQMLAQIAERQR